MKAKVHDASGSKLRALLYATAGISLMFASCPGPLKSETANENLNGKVELIVSKVDPMPVLAGTPQFYVSPKGQRRGDGSINNPWDFSTVCGGSADGSFVTPPAAIKPGSTILLRAGTYTGAFRCRFNGTASAPITLRAYAGERVIIDRPAIDGQNAVQTPLWLEGNYIWAIGLEITNSNPTRKGTQDDGYARPICVAMTGLSTKLINSFVHDCGVGVFPGATQHGGEVYGNLIYNNGWIDTRLLSTGHGIYAQNLSNTKLIKDNIVFNNYGWGIHAYGTSQDNLKGFDIIGNAVFGSGGPGHTTHPDLELGGANIPASRVNIDSNYFYWYGGLDIGYHFPNNMDLRFTNNVIWMGGWVTTGWQTATVTGNRWQGQLTEMSFDHPRSTFIPSQYDWDHNEYHYLGTGSPFIVDNASRGEFNFWRKQTGFDSNSTFTTAPLKGVTIYLRPNAYDPNRSHIIIYNWDGKATVTVDVSSVLPAGARYELRNVEDYFGTPVLTGVYNGQPLQVPMTGLNIVAPLGGSAAERRNEANFNVFVLTRR
jgi:parallel beta-helix repeat protein